MVQMVMIVVVLVMILVCNNNGKESRTGNGIMYDNDSVTVGRVVVGGVIQFFI